MIAETIMTIFVATSHLQQEFLFSQVNTEVNLLVPDRSITGQEAFIILNAWTDNKILGETGAPFGTGLDREELTKIESDVKRGERGNTPLAQKILGIVEILLENFERISSVYGVENEIENTDLGLSLRGNVDQPIRDVLGEVSTATSESFIEAALDRINKAISEDSDPVKASMEILQQYTPEERERIEKSFRTAIDDQSDPMQMLILAERLKIVELANYQLDADRKRSGK